MTTEAESRINYGTESRSLSVTYEVRGVKGKPNAILVGGRASNHGNWYDVGSRFQERTHYPVLKNADTSECVLLYGHEGMPYGSVAGGNLSVSESTRGIEWQCELDNRSQAHNDLAVMLERGDATQGSVGMVVRDDKWSTNRQQRDVYGLSHLYDVTICPMGSNPQTESKLVQRSRAVHAMAENPEEVRHVLWCASETRKGRKISGANKAKLGTALGHLQQAGVHIQDLLATNGEDPNSFTNLVPDASIGGGSNGGDQWGPGGGMSGDATGSRHLTARQRDLLQLYREKLEDEEREDEARRKMVQEILHESRLEYLS